MIFRKKADILFQILNIYGRLSSTWPPISDLARKKLVYEFTWWFTLIIVILLLIPLVISVFHFRNNNMDMLAQTASELTALIEVFINMIICKVQTKRLQVIVKYFLYKKCLVLIGSVSHKIIVHLVIIFRKFYVQLINSKKKQQQQKFVY